MKSVFRILPAAGLALALAMAALPAAAQQAAAPPKAASPTAIAAAKEILAMKNASAMYQNAVPNIVQQTIAGIPLIGERSRDPRGCETKDRDGYGPSGSEQGGQGPRQRSRC